MSSLSLVVQRDLKDTICFLPTVNVLPVLIHRQGLGIDLFTICTASQVYSNSGNRTMKTTLAARNLQYSGED